MLGTVRPEASPWRRPAPADLGRTPAGRTQRLAAMVWRSCALTPGVSLVGVTGGRPPALPPPRAGLPPVVQAIKPRVDVLAAVTEVPADPKAARTDALVPGALATGFHRQRAHRTVRRPAQQARELTVCCRSIFLTTWRWRQ